MISPVINNETNNREEKLFWSVYRNKFIREIIWKMVKSNGCSLNVYKYDQINNVEWMLMKGYHQLLWSKVKNGEYLLFKCTIFKKNIHTNSSANGFQFKQQEFRNDGYEYSIFNSFKDDIQFHSKLLSNYPMYFKPTTKEMLEELEIISIKYDNLALLKVLINEYSLKPQFSTLESSIEHVSSEIANYLMLNIKFDINKKQSNQLWEIVLSTDDYNLFNERVELYLNKLRNNQPPTELFTNFNLFNTLLFNLPLKSIIQSCHTIIYLKQSLDSFINSFSKDKYNKLKKFKDQCINDLKSEKFTILSFYELTEIKLKYINTDFMDMRVYEFNQDNEDIKKLYNMLIMFTGTNYNYIFSNYRYYQAKYYGKYYKVEESSKLFNPFKFGDFSYETAGQTTDLFFYCPNDSIKHQSYIKQLCSDHSRKQSNELLKSLAYHFIDNLNILKIISHEFKQIPGNENESIITIYHLSRTNSFEKPKLFEFIYESIQFNDGNKDNQFDSIIGPILLSFYFVYQFSNFFITNYKTQYFKWIIEKHNVYLNKFDPRYSINILNNWSDYQENLPLEIQDSILNKLWGCTDFVCLSKFKLLVQISTKRLHDLNYSLIKNWSFSVYTFNKIESYEKIDYILSSGNSYLVDLLMDGKFFGTSRSDIIMVSYLKSYLDNGDNSLEFIKENGLLDTLISKYKIYTVISSFKNSIIIKSDITLLKHLISKINSLSDKDYLMEHVNHYLIINIISSYISIANGGYTSYYFGNLTVLKFILNYFDEVSGSLPNLEIQNLLISFYSLFSIALNNGDIDMINLFIQSSLIDNPKYILPDMKFAPKNYNFHIPNFFKFHYPHKKIYDNLFE